MRRQKRPTPKYSTVPRRHSKPRSAENSYDPPVPPGAARTASTRRPHWCGSHARRSRSSGRLRHSARRAAGSRRRESEHGGRQLVGTAKSSAASPQPSGVSSSQRRQQQHRRTDRQSEGSQNQQPRKQFPPGDPPDGVTLFRHVRLLPPRLQSWESRSMPSSSSAPPSSTGTLECSRNQRPRSIWRHRSEQKGSRGGRGDRECPTTNRAVEFRGHQVAGVASFVVFFSVDLLLAGLDSADFQSLELHS